MELGTEKAATQKLESSKLVLERQNKELKAKLAELETNTRTKTKVLLLDSRAPLSTKMLDFFLFPNVSKGLEVDNGLNCFDKL